MGTTILVLCLIICIVALLMLTWAFIRSEQKSKEQLLLQQTWENAQESRYEKLREEHDQVVIQLQKRLSEQTEHIQKEKQFYTEELASLRKQHKEQVQRLIQHYTGQIKQLTIDYELALLPHIEDVTLPDQEQKNKRQWRPLQLPDADLSGKDLSHRYLAQANLQNAILINANLFMADLNGAKLADANLSGADLSATNLTSADLSGAILTETNMLVADLKNANLIGANTERARNLTQEQLASATPNLSQS